MAREQNHHLAHGGDHDERDGKQHDPDGLAGEEARLDQSDNEREQDQHHEDAGLAGAGEAADEAHAAAPAE